MKWAAIIGVSLIVLLMALYEWPKMNRNQKKEKAAFVIISALGWLNVVLLIFNPEMPGTRRIIEVIYKPLGKLLEK